MSNTYQKFSLKTLPMYNKQILCGNNQKCHFIANKGVITMKSTRDVLNNETTLGNDQEHLKNVE